MFWGTAIISVSLSLELEKTNVRDMNKDYFDVAKMARRIVVTTAMAMSLSLPAVADKVDPPQPCGPVPSENQLKWQDMEMYAFIHFSLNTDTHQ